MSGRKKTAVTHVCMQHASEDMMTATLKVKCHRSALIAEMIRMLLRVYSAYTKM